MHLSRNISMFTPTASFFKDLDTRGPFDKRGLTLNPTLINNYMPGKVWDEISFPFSNFKDATGDIWEWISYLIPNSIWVLLSIHAGIKVNPC